MELKQGVLFGLALLAFLVVSRWMGSASDSEFHVSGDRLAEIVDQIRDGTREKWLKHQETMEEYVGLAGTGRDRLFAKIRDGSLGKPYHKDLTILLKEKHAAIEEVEAGPDSSLADVFESVKNAERRLTNTYLDIIAARTALDHEIPAVDAVSYAKVVQPDRISLNKEVLDSEIRTKKDGRLDTFKSNINKGASEIDAILKYAEMVLENMEAELDGEMGEGVEVALDATVMGSTAGEQLRPDQLNMDDQGTSDGGFGAVGGRIISKDSLANRNLYIDKWYVMGPFENRFRSAIDASFLPESVVDLDHTTIGKGGKQIGWDYWRCSKLRIEPRFAPNGAVYYGWSEIWVDKPGGYWVSMGSDDYGKLWVNGELVWKSGTQPKAFRADEHTMEINLKQGVNEILFRCENGGGTMGWTLVFHAAAMEE